MLHQSHFHVTSGISLHPVSPVCSSHSLHTLGLNIVDAEALPWSPDYFPLGTLHAEAGLVDWVRVTLQRERVALEKAGIYKAVFLSMFRYT